MATNGRERMGDVSEFLLLLGERLAEAAYRVRVEAIKATKIGRVRMEMVMLRRERRAAVFRVGEAALEAVREGRVADPVLVARAREVEDVGAALEAKAEEAGRIADLPDDEILERRKEAQAKAEANAEAVRVETETSERLYGDSAGAVPVTPKEGPDAAEPPLGPRA